MSIRKILCLFAFATLILAISGCGRRIFYESVPPSRNAANVPARQIEPRVIIEPVQEPRIIQEPMPEPIPVPMPEPMPTAPANSGSATSRGLQPQIQVPKPLPPPPQTRTLASHETEFDAKDENRSNNITKAAETVNGTVVQPGGVFSFNETVGPTIERRGYKKSIIYKDGEKKEGVGGGVCQVSTTIHQAAENAGMSILERHDHSLPVNYAKSGEEAATSYGVIDFKFRNDQNYAVKINCRVEDGKLRVCIDTVP